jgi:hypothetical protein
MIEGLIALTLAAVGSIIWAIRQEGLISQVAHRVTRIEKDVDEAKNHIGVLDSRVFKELTEIKIALAKIEGALSLLNNDKKN